MVLEVARLCVDLAQVALLWKAVVLFRDFVGPGKPLDEADQLATPSDMWEE